MTSCKACEFMTSYILVWREIRRWFTLFTGNNVTLRIRKCVEQDLKILTKKNDKINFF